MIGCIDVPTSDPDSAKAAQLDTLAAIWILASNDENPEVSYRGIRFRLRLDDSLDVQKLVAERGELFRLAISRSRVHELKERYGDGKHIPSWLRALPEDQRRDAIAQLTGDDFFRSQFRTEAGAIRSPIEIVDWGLKHIDRLRAAVVEKRESRLRQWTSKWIPLLSTFVAVVALFTSTYLSAAQALISAP